jgi:hypothetical protein
MLTGVIATKAMKVESMLEPLALRERGRGEGDATKYQKPE